jgi:uncharacterized 2Fe-2S/4Fe-4S cluster protein (DUF4445 family)
MRHFRVVFKDDGRAVSIHQGATLLEAAGQAGIVLTTSCGGKGLCGKCAVILKPSEQQVLACQYTVQSDLLVSVPAQSRYYECRILRDGPNHPKTIDLTIVNRYRLADGPSRAFGVAVDIGTTTVVAKLVDLADGRCLATEAMLNPQTRFGDDVISRISYAQSDAQRDELCAVIIDCLNVLIGRLCRAGGIDASRIYETCIVGNTTMNHILLRFPLEQLGQAPYRAYSVEAHDFPPTQLHLRMNPAGNVHTVENIAGFVGSDTTAGSLAVEIDTVDSPTLMVDIGTNGEIVLAAEGRLYAASCAAGPALEGARIRHGSRATDGAIEAVVIDEQDIVVDTIGTATARSICGSGLIDAVAALLDLGVIDPSGRFVPAERLSAHLSPGIASRLVEVDGQPAFCLAFDPDGRTAVVVTQKDIREFQLAKGAIRAGITLLLKRTGVDETQLDRILLAGAFGNYIRPRSAVRVGLLPDIPVERIQSVGNAAVSGARMILLSEQYRQKASSLAKRIEYVEIANEPNFGEVFSDAMSLRS